MISFANDYSEGACEKILNKLIQTNLEQTCGYGLDEYCEESRNTIRTLVEDSNADVHFLVGGTQANTIVIASALRPYEAVISVDSGHINVHETGAIEATGHKVISVTGINGKITPASIENAVKQHTDEHMVKPKMVYLSNATEIGTVYTKKELEMIHEVCQKYNLYVFMDGARLGSAFTSEENDLTWTDLPKYFDVFYIGGTKNGALFGETVVIINEELKTEFRYSIKQRGGMLAKGRLLGLQFQALLEDDTYLTLAKHANDMAQKLQTGFEELGLLLLHVSPTNQIFVKLSHEVADALYKNYVFQVWEPVDEEHTMYRFVTSWATKEESVDALLNDLRNLLCN